MTDAFKRPERLQQRQVHSFTLASRGPQLELPLTHSHFYSKSSSTTPGRIRAYTLTVEIQDGNLVSVMAYGLYVDLPVRQPLMTTETWRPDWPGQDTRDLDEWLAAHQMPIVAPGFDKGWVFEPSEPDVGILADAVIHDACGLFATGEIEPEVTTTCIASYSYGQFADRVIVRTWRHACVCGESILTQSHDPDPEVDPYEEDR